MTGLLLLLVLQTSDVVLSNVAIEQKLGTAIDPDIVLRDESGAPLRIGDLFGKRPMLLTPVYYECPMLCSLQLNALGRAMKVMPFTLGKEFDVITFSIDPTEKATLAAQKKAGYIREYGRPGAERGWRFLTGDAESIRRLTENIGYRYVYDDATGQFAHASTLLTLTADGRISQYSTGIEYDPGDLKYALIQASDGKIGSFIDHALLYCYQYDPSTGRYSLSVLRAIRIAGILTMAALAAFMVLSRKRSRNSGRQAPHGTGQA